MLSLLPVGLEVPSHNSASITVLSICFMLACIGQALSLLEVKEVVHHLLQNYEFYSGLESEVTANNLVSFRIGKHQIHVRHLSDTQKSSL